MKRGCRTVMKDNRTKSHIGQQQRLLGCRLIYQPWQQKKHWNKPNVLQSLL